MTNLENRVIEARKNDYGFDRLVQACEEKITKFSESVLASNDQATVWLRRPVTTRDVHLRVYVPAVPITPKEVDLLDQYLNEKYMSYGCRKFAGSRIKIRKCLFKDAYKIYTPIEIDCFPY